MAEGRDRASLEPMITPVPMELVSFVVLKEKAEEAASRLLALGVFHPVDLRNIEDTLQSLSSFQIDKDLAVCDALQLRIREVSRRMGLELVQAARHDIGSFSYAAAGEFLDSVEKQVKTIIDSREEIEHQMATDQSILAHVRDYMPFSPRRSSLYSFLEVSTGKLEEKNAPVLEKSLADIPHVMYPFRTEGTKVLAMVIGLRRDRALLNKVLRDVGWEEIAYPREVADVSKEAQAKLVRKIEEYKEKIAGLNDRIRDLAGRHEPEIAAIHAAVRLNRSLLEAKRYSCLTDKTALFAGWVPASDKEKVVRAIKSISGISYVESQPPEAMAIAQEDVPVKFGHGAVLKPFDMLIEAYGIPRYGTVDPTIFVAISFLIMFGAMFGDIGHGAVLVMVSLLLGRRKASEGLRHTKALLLYSGASACLFGGLYGSFFGVEFPSVWIKPIENIMEVFKISIYLGIGMITLGILINVVNALRDRDYVKVLFDKAGLIGGIIYWAAIGLVSKLFISKTQIPAYYSLVILGGVLALFLYPLVDCVAKRKYSHLMESFMESLVGILEVFMGYLANTVSFIRVAAFALAHTGLFIAIFDLAKIVHTEGSTGDVLSWIVLILGNVLAVALEGLVVAIQSVRLNYYEFFSKFFMAGKSVYKPLSV
ncbi:MAG TPA: V-type ATPase 116kDa subunit family protein [Candidatus Omnitrophota bacterium]|nr:V-type ATPase 116kDa subunit family protein [Candidatus Omnitrophota bacterium]HQQ05631.1 V-type ATPase 116kDa subunit family protein [Candidatus Omnitrophota bacterium]